MCTAQKLRKISTLVDFVMHHEDLRAQKLRKISTLVDEDDKVRTGCAQKLRKISTLVDVNYLFSAFSPRSFVKFLLLQILDFYNSQLLAQKLRKISTLVDTSASKASSLAQKLRKISTLVDGVSRLQRLVAQKLRKISTLVDLILLSLRSRPRSFVKFLLLQMQIFGEENLLGLEAS